jgi:hypothetical protein
MTLIAAIAATVVPVVGHADVNPALERCVQIFIKEVVPAGSSVDVRHEDILASTRAISTARSAVTLIARGEGSSVRLGRASCVIHRNGSLVAMYLYGANSGPRGSNRPKVLARNLDATQGARTASVDDTKPF